MGKEYVNYSKINSENPRLSTRFNVAYNFAEKIHEKQRRKSNEPFIVHPIAVCDILIDEWGVKKENYLIAAILHDSIEDTPITIQEIENKFGNEVAELISGVTKLEKSTDHDTIKKVLDNTYVNPGVAVIKLADRLHNMRTLEFLSREKQESKSRETLDVYSKLAESLGMWEVKIELEDLCFKYLLPKQYKKISTQIDEDPRLDSNFIGFVKSNIEQLLVENRINGDVESIKNGYWFLKEKQKKAALKGESFHNSFENINDLLSIRVKLDSLDDCYTFLKHIHQEFDGKVDYDRFDEFIGSNKRLNGYQAIQTTINFSRGPVEISLMTKEMDEFNNLGVVNLINRDQDYDNYKLKLVFTPTGKVKFLSKNATGVDYAAAISNRVLAEGNSICIDDQEVPFATLIPNGSMVRVNLGEPRRGPLLGIEDFAAMPATRRIIKELRILEDRDSFIQKGQQSLEKILIPRGLLVLSDISKKSINPLLYKLGCKGVDDLYFMLGSGAVRPNTISKELTLSGITKENLCITTIRLQGSDRPKILADVTQKISEIDKNIIRVEQKIDDDHFNIRLLVKDMSQADEEYIKEFLHNDPRFSESIVV